jgi:hypothetical protein
MSLNCENFLLLKKIKMEDQLQTTEEKKLPKWKSLLKKFGIGGIIFFTVKGIITSTLIYFLGKNFWTIIQDYVTQWFD